MYDRASFPPVGEAAVLGAEISGTVLAAIPQVKRDG
jgi:hypothetical protein